MAERQHKNPESKPSRSFRLDEVLTALTGNTFIDTADDPDRNAFTRRIGGLLGFMAGEDHPEVFQLARLSDEAAPAIAQQHPELGALLAQMPAEPPEDARPIERTGYNRRLMEWKDSIYRTYGERMDEPIELSPLGPGDHTHIDAGVEFDLHGGTTLPLPEVAASLGIDAQAARPAAADLPPFDWDAAEAQFTPPRLEAIGPDITESGRDRRDHAYDLARRMVSNSTTHLPHETAEPGALHFDTAGYQRELENRTAFDLNNQRTPPGV